MSDSRIRAETAHDIGAITRLTTAAFATAEHSSGTEARIVEALRRAGALTLSLVAVDDERLVGHVAFSPVLIDGKAQRWFGLGPLSVAPDRQRAGIGSKLVRQGLQQLRADGADGCVVLGDPAYYGRFAFIRDPALTFQGAPAEYFMRLAFHGPVPKGAVSYHNAFFID